MALDTPVTKPAYITPTKSKNKAKSGEKATPNSNRHKNQIILAQRVVKGPKHDFKDVIPLIRKVKKYNPI